MGATRSADGLVGDDVPTQRLVRVSGTDRPGITAAVLEALAGADVSLLEMDQLVVRGKLTLDLLVAAPVAVDLDGLLVPLAGDLGVRVDVEPAPTPTDAPGDGARSIVTVIAPRLDRRRTRRGDRWRSPTRGRTSPGSSASLTARSAPSSSRVSGGRSSRAAQRPARRRRQPWHRRRRAARAAGAAREAARAPRCRLDAHPRRGHRAHRRRGRSGRRGRRDHRPRDGRRARLRGEPAGAGPRCSPAPTSPRSNVPRTRSGSRQVRARSSRRCGGSATSSPSSPEASTMSSPRSLRRWASTMRSRTGWRSPTGS